MANDILVFGEVRGGGIKKITKELIGAARSISQANGGAIDAVLIGRGAGAAAASLASFGLRKIIVAEDEILGTYSTEGYATVLGLHAEVVAVKRSVQKLATRVSGPSLGATP